MLVHLEEKQLIFRQTVDMENNADPPPLHSSLCTGSPQDVEVMRRLLASDPKCLENVVTSDSQYMLTPLMLAVSSNHLACTDFLLTSGAKVNSRVSGETALSLAIEAGNTEMVHLLLRYGASPNYQTTSGLHETYYLVGACKEGHSEIVSLLLRFGAMTEEERPVLYYYNGPQSEANINGHTECLKVLLLHSTIAPDIIRVNLLHRRRTLECGDTTSPSVLEQRKVNLKMMCEFGANLWLTNVRGHSLLDLLRKKLPYLVHTLQTLMSTPLRLQSLARLSIKKSMGRRYVENISKLTLPEALKDFLAFDEFNVCDKQ